MFATRIWRTCSAGAAAAFVAVALSPQAHGGDFDHGEQSGPDDVAALRAESAPGHGAAATYRGVREDGPSTAPPNAVAGGPRKKVGRWVKGRKGVVDLPTFAIHAAMLPTGKVLFWGYPPRAADGTHEVNAGRAALWNPRRGTGRRSVERVNPPAIDPDGPGPQPRAPAPLYGAGQSLLPTGDVLVMGGNRVWPEQFPDDGYDSNAGLDTVFTFDPFAERWRRQGDMAGGRWQPSQVLMGDGRTAVLGGLTGAPTPPGAGPAHSDDAEVFIAPRRRGGRGSVRKVGEGSPYGTSLSPHLFGLPNDTVMMFGPGYWETNRFDYSANFPFPDRSFGSDAPDGRSRFGGTAVLEPGGFGGSWSALQLGGFDDNKPTAEDPSIFHATDTATRLDGETLEATMAPSTRLARSHANTVLLPDRSMVTVGGGRGRGDGYGLYYTDDDSALKRVELYDPKRGSWKLGPSQREYRTYHSVALLLPDGRVWSAGDDYHEVEPAAGDDGFRGSTADTGEIYEPPYLFGKGKRPRIKKAPAKISYGERFRIRTKGGRGRTAVLMAPGATSRGVDGQQRMVVLKKLRKRKRKGLVMRAPEESGAAPPGYYMLFVIGHNGKPSVAKWVRFRA